MAPEPITQLLRRLARDEPGAADGLAQAVSGELERIAAREMSRRNRGHLGGLTLEPGVFADDALLKLVDSPVAFENRRHFFSYATKIIVRALVDYHRSRNAAKRGGDYLRVSLADLGSAEPVAFDIEEIPPILEELESLDPRKADGVRLRVFWGATADEVASILEVSPATVERDWRFSRRWLASRLREAGEAGV